ncbi:protein of unknown function [Pseudomonas mediterranea]
MLGLDAEGENLPLGTFPGMSRNDRAPRPSGLREMPSGSDINTFSLAEECSNKGRGYGSSSQTGVSNSGRLGAVLRYGASARARGIDPEVDAEPASGRGDRAARCPATDRCRSRTEPGLARGFRQGRRTPPGVSQ